MAKHARGQPVACRLAGAVSRAIWHAAAGAFVACLLCWLPPPPSVVVPSYTPQGTGGRHGAPRLLLLLQLRYGALVLQLVSYALSFAHDVAAAVELCALGKDRVAASGAVRRREPPTGGFMASAGTDPPVVYPGNRSGHRLPPRSCALRLQTLRDHAFLVAATFTTVAAFTAGVSGAGAEEWSSYADADGVPRLSLFVAVTSAFGVDLLCVYHRSRGGASLLLPTSGLLSLLTSALFWVASASAAWWLPNSVAMPYGDDQRNWGIIPYASLLLLAVGGFFASLGLTMLAVVARVECNVRWALWTGKVSLTPAVPYGTDLLTPVSGCCSGEAYKRRKQRLDVWVPHMAMPHPKRSSGLRPVVVVVHGGMYRFGDRTDVRGVGVSFARATGCIVVCVSYRLAPRVRMPEPVRDVARAVAWVADQARSFGGDPERLVLVGHSAGAHAVTMLCVDRGILADAFAERASQDGVVHTCPHTSCVRGGLVLSSGRLCGPMLRKRRCCLPQGGLKSICCFCAPIQPRGAPRHAHLAWTPLHVMRSMRTTTFSDVEDALARDSDDRGHLLDDSLSSIDQQYGGVNSLAAGSDVTRSSDSCCDLVPRLLIAYADGENTPVIHHSRQFVEEATRRGIECELGVVRGESHMSEIMRVGLSDGDPVTHLVADFVARCAGGP